MRFGVNTGEVVAGDASARQAFASGDAVNVAARLEQAASPARCCSVTSTLRLVRDAVTVEEVEPLALKGKSQPVRAWRLIDVARGAGVAAGIDAPLVGRARELSQFLEAWRTALREHDARIVTVVAPAGLARRD